MKNKYMIELQNEFTGRTKKKQIDILLRYTTYVATYPDDHDEGSYPACFWEWYDNDYCEMEEITL
jgi:hypothetical protein